MHDMALNGEEIVRSAHLGCLTGMGALSTVLFNLWAIVSAPGIVMVVVSLCGYTGV